MNAKRTQAHEPDFFLSLYTNRSKDCSCLQIHWSDRSGFVFHSVDALQRPDVRMYTMYVYMILDRSRRVKWSKIHFTHSFLVGAMRCNAVYLLCAIRLGSNVWFKWLYALALYGLFLMTALRMKKRKAKLSTACAKRIGKTAATITS